MTFIDLMVFTSSVFMVVFYFALISSDLGYKKSTVKVNITK